MLSYFSLFFFVCSFRLSLMGWITRWLQFLSSNRPFSKRKQKVVFLTATFVLNLLILIFTKHWLLFNDSGFGFGVSLLRYTHSRSLLRFSSSHFSLVTWIYTLKRHTSRRLFFPCLLFCFWLFCVLCCFIIALLPCSACCDHVRALRFFDFRLFFFFRSLFFVFLLRLFAY